MILPQPEGPFVQRTAAAGDAVGTAGGIDDKDVDPLDSDGLLNDVQGFRQDLIDAQAFGSRQTEILQIFRVDDFLLDEHVVDKTLHDAVDQHGADGEGQRDQQGIVRGQCREMVADKGGHGIQQIDKDNRG